MADYPQEYYNKVNTMNSHRSTTILYHGYNKNNDKLDEFNLLIKDNKIEELLKEFENGQTTRS